MDWLPLILAGDAGVKHGSYFRSRPGLAGHLIYGPYLELPAGNYIASLVISAAGNGKASASGSVTGPVIVIEVVTGNTILAQAHLSAIDLQKRIQVLEFRLSELAIIETRVWTSGFVDLSVEAVEMNVRPGPQLTEQPGQFSTHHPVFDRFKAFSGSVPLEFAVDFLGFRVRHEFSDGFQSRSCLEVTGSLPPVDESYFEWIDLLLSVARSKNNHYTALELGAGYGRWAIRGALAARQRGIAKIKIGMAEADPAHMAWLRQTLRDNGISAEQSIVYECAVSDRDGTAYLAVAQSQVIDEHTPQRWFGQFIVRHASVCGKAGALYYGHELLQLDLDGMAVEVWRCDIARILKDYEEIDFLDMDVQGEEARIVAGGIEQMNQKVKLLFIGTHGSELEFELKQVLWTNGWILIRDYPWHQVSPTPFGEVSFDDGVQTWVNPRRASVSDYLISTHGFANSAMLPD